MQRSEVVENNIVIITAVYPPEPVVSARMALDLATHLAFDNNNSVTVICPIPSRPINSHYSEYIISSRPHVCKEGNINVVRLPSITAPASQLFHRLIESWSFGRYVCKYLSASIGTNPDVIYVNSWPILAQLLIVKYARAKKIPVVLQIMDVYPESLLVKLPRIVGKLVSYPLFFLDAWMSRSVQSLIVISENMRKQYIDSRNVPMNRIFMIPTWQDESLFEMSADRKSACNKYNVPEQPFTFLYLGNIGPVAGVDFIIKAFHEANICQSQLLIVGDGSEKSKCVELAARLQIVNIHFINDPEVSNVPILQSMAHVCLLPVCKGAGLSSIPSKLVSYMFSSKPVLATIDQSSDTAHTIKYAGCGWVGDPEDLQWLVYMMKMVVELDIQTIEHFGSLGRDYALQHFSKSYGVRELSKVVLEQISQ